ncbi:MAG: peptidase S8, partial [Actinomycetota bacterium]|nr:peptidase S8 [Actinomycetota bacterium]
MRRLAPLLALPLLLPVIGGPPAAAEPGDVVPGAYVVTLVDGADADAVAAEHGRRHDAAVDHVYRSA